MGHISVRFWFCGLKDDSSSGFAAYFYVHSFRCNLYQGLKVNIRVDPPLSILSDSDQSQGTSELTWQTHRAKNPALLFYSHAPSACEIKFCDLFLPIWFKCGGAPKAKQPQVQLSRKRQGTDGKQASCFLVIRHK